MGRKGQVPDTCELTELRTSLYAAQTLLLLGTAVRVSDIPATSARGSSAALPMWGRKKQVLRGTAGHDGRIWAPVWPLTAVRGSLCELSSIGVADTAVRLGKAALGKADQRSTDLQTEETIKVLISAPLAHGAFLPGRVSKV